MKAVVFRPSRGLVYEEVPDYQVAVDEVLVRVANTGFCGSDHSLVAGGPPMGAKDDNLAKSRRSCPSC